MHIFINGVTRKDKFMDKIKFEKLIGTEEPKKIIRMHYNRLINLDSRQLDKVIKLLFKFGFKTQAFKVKFLGIIKSDPQLKEMIDQQKLKRQYEQKVSDRQNIGQLIPADENKRISNRQQADILQIQNSEMSRQIQKNRARIATRQNNLSSISINNNNSLNRFQDMVNEINLSTQTIETRQQQKAEQDVQMQL